MYDYELGRNPKISEVINVLEKAKEKLGDTECEIVYDGMDADVNFFESSDGKLVLFMS